MNELILLWDIAVILVRNVGPLFFGAGLLLAFGFWVTFLFIVPAIRIYKEVRSGRTFKEAWWEVFEWVEGHHSAVRAVRRRSHKRRSTSITGYVNNPLYSSMPGNIYNRN